MLPLRKSPAHSAGNLNPADYQVAWIVPLKIQVQAALHLLDVRHDGKFPVPRGDEYVYHAGHMSNYNIIIATLATHQEYSTRSVAELANQVHRIFPHILFGLLLGVTAGIPQNPDYNIRLGDVLVSLPNQGRFITSHRQTILRAALHSLEPKESSDPTGFLPFYEAIRDNERATGTFDDPSQDPNNPYLDHPDEAEDVVVRTRQSDAQRNRMWYISANRRDDLFTNTRTRNEPRDEYEPTDLDIAVIERIQFPFGVIRGVYAYGDRPKNVEWQPYAAAMAAAFAKAVLMAIPPLPYPHGVEQWEPGTPLLWAASLGYEKLVALLLTTEEHDINSKDNNGQTPLSLAASHGHQEVVKLLLATPGIDINSQNNDGETPLSLATLRGHRAIIKLIADRQIPKAKPVLGPEHTSTPVRTDTEGLPERTPARFTASGPIQQQTEHNREPTEASLRQQSAQPIPPGFIQRLDDRHFRVKTRNRCNDVFVDTIRASTEEEAERFFRAVDRYDKWRGPVRKFRSRLLDLYLTFAPLAKLGGTPIVIPKESLELGALNVTPSDTAREDSTLTARQDPDPITSTVVPPDDGASPRLEGGQPPQDPNHQVFICVALGRPDRWRLKYAEFEGRNDKPNQISDTNIFNEVRVKIGEYQKLRGLLRFLFPLRVSKVGYYEFNVHNVVRNSVTLGEPDKLPSDHDPRNEWRTRCPSHMWYFIEPVGPAKSRVKDGLAGPPLTDAVCNPHEFDGHQAVFRYYTYLPWKLRVKFSNSDDFRVGWGLAVRFEFNFFVFWCIWGTMTLLLSLALLFGLYVAADGPAHGQPGVAVAIFLAPSGILGTVFTGAYAYAKQNKYLD